MKALVLLKDSSTQTIDFSKVSVEWVQDNVLKVIEYYH